MKRRTLLALLFSTGCAPLAVPPGAAPSPVPAAAPTPAASMPAASPTDPPSFQAGGAPPWTLPGYVGPRPLDATLDPPGAPDGTRATAGLVDLPPGARVEVWHTGWMGPFRHGVPHPKDVPGATKVGEATAGADGRATLGFVVPAVTDFQGTHVLWLVLPGGEVRLNAYSWQARYPSRVEGVVRDETGEPVADGSATLQAVYGSERTPSAFGATARIRDGRYAFEGVPLPAGGRIVLTRPGWPDRVRPFGDGEVHRAWGAEAGEPGGDAWQRAIIAHRGDPVTLDFGGPGSAKDPDGPLYFFSSRADEPAYRTTAIVGRVFDAEGRSVPTDEGAEVHAQVDPSSDRPGNAVRARVVDGAYRLDGVATERPIRLELVRPPRCSAIAARTLRALPAGITGRDVVADFGGPPSTTDPEAARLPYRRPDPRTGDPCIGNPAYPAPMASAPIP